MKTRSSTLTWISLQLLDLSLISHQLQLLPDQIFLSGMGGGEYRMDFSEKMDTIYSNMMRMSMLEKPKTDSFCVTADLLIPGKGQPIKNGCIVVEGSKITHVGDASTIAIDFAHLSRTHVKVLMPGMWDCHVHLMGIHKVSSAAIVNTSTQMALSGARCARDVMLLLDAGFTSVREMGGYGIQLDQAISEGTLVGPKIYSANSIIRSVDTHIEPLGMMELTFVSMTGGHADPQDMPLDWFHDAACHGLPMCTADGVPDCLKAVRLQLRAGAKVIKICGSGGVGSERDNPVDQQFSDKEIAAMVEEAARAQRIVGAHCHGKPGIIASLRAGVKTIEHGSYIDEECCELMKKNDAILVATRLIVENGLKLKDMFTPVRRVEVKSPV